MQIYNSLSGHKEKLVPIEPGRIGLYVCGITAYDDCHLGHARMMVTFDMVVRFLRMEGYAVHYVRNITDIDDKIIARAKKEDRDIGSIVEDCIQSMHKDAQALGIVAPDEEPRATLHMNEIITLIQQLMNKGYAYQQAQGDVLYSVRRFADYGKLSGKTLDSLRAGARVEVDPNKKDPLDFVLWKKARPGEPAWSSPWGEGRPGWHIECSAMSMRCLGKHFDIHGGGLDLKFPHHENEIAQSEAATGEIFSNIWMHNGFVQWEDEKMSKSLGNILTIRNTVQRHHPEAVRYWILSTHYRSPLRYDENELESARRSLARLYQTVAANSQETGTSPENDDRLAPIVEDFIDAMRDDFNTPKAISILFQLDRRIRQARQDGESDFAHQGALAMKRLAEPLGFLRSAPDEFAAYQPGLPAHLDHEKIDAMVSGRVEARRNKNWARADELRKELFAMGIVLEDSATGTRWHYQPGQGTSE